MTFRWTYLSLMPSERTNSLPRDQLTHNMNCNRAVLQSQHPSRVDEGDKLEQSETARRWEEMRLCDGCHTAIAVTSADCFSAGAAIRVEALSQRRLAVIMFQVSLLIPVALKNTTSTCTILALYC